ITQGTQPIISYNFGANRLDRVKECFKKVLVVTFTLTTVASLAAICFPTVFARIFTPEAQLIELVAQVLPIYMAGVWIFGVQMACQATFIGLGQAKISLFLALLRKVFLLVPMAIILPRIFGVIGIYYAEPIADITSAIVAGCMFIVFFRKLMKSTEKAVK
ncbi:MAG: MATE family efflux transporter, partial [Oscillospiraceae bacterium]